MRGHGRHEELKDLWKSSMTQLTAVNYAIIGCAAVLWLALLICYWVLVMDWLYQASVTAGMKQSLWTILGRFLDLFAVFAVLIIRDNHGKCKVEGSEVDAEK